MLRDAHKGLETMSAAAAAIKDERWDEAKRALDELQRIAAELTRLVGEKQREQRVAALERHARD
jgi:flagellin-specific chaperone FliS